MGRKQSEGYQPANALLVRIDELKKVKGWETFTSTPGWDDEFTVNSTGPVDLAWAPRDVLRALPGFTDAMVERFLQLRAGPDGKDGTADDTVFNKSRRHPCRARTFPGAISRAQSFHFVQGFRLTNR